MYRFAPPRTKNLVITNINLLRNHVSDFGKLANSIWNQNALATNVMNAYNPTEAVVYGRLIIKVS